MRVYRYVYEWKGIGSMRKYLSILCICICLLYTLTGCGNTSAMLNQKGGSGNSSDRGEMADDQSEGALSDENGLTEQGQNPTGVDDPSFSAAAASTEIVNRPDSEYDTISNSLQAWWFKRNTDHTMSGCQEDFDIRQYHAYYANENPTDNVIYLTFDCGYENGYTPQILDALKEQDVKAIFFVTQHFVEDQPELVKRMKEEGHLVGNHTNHHPSLPSLSIEKQREEITSCAEKMKELTGYDMDPYMRPPKGEYSERTLQLMEDMGYCTIFWSMAYLDYEVDNQPSPDYVVQHFVKYVHPGAMPLLHNVSSANAQALPALIESMREAGYRFGRIDEFCHF